MRVASMTRFYLGIAFLVTILSSVSSADLTISAVGFPLLPNTSNQTVTLNVTTDSSDQIDAINLRLQVGDGGSGDLGTGTDVAGVNMPFITAIDFSTGLFASASLTPAASTSLANGGLLAQRNADLAVATPASGLLAAVVFSTVGINSPGSFDFLLDGVFETSAVTTGSMAIPINFASSVNSGSVSAVPEPSAFLLLGLISIGTVVGRWSVKKFLVRSC